MGKKKSKQKQEDIKKDISIIELNNEEQIEFAFKIMDRTDLWINSCDNKISVLLGICGIVLTVCLTTDSVSAAYAFIENILSNIDSMRAYLFVVGCIITVFFYLKLIYHIGSTLIVRVDSGKFSQEEVYINSNLFFGNISLRKYKEYKDDFLNSSSKDRVNDILSQVYINSLIAQKKYFHYNKCIILMGLSALSTFVVVVYGIIAF